ncbi:MAG: hypothetical protein H7Y05_12745 [Steroidobacteraceae bacterium]|nr:hypothetical protein [Deltaproteobacteria bacterium]
MPNAIISYPDRTLTATLSGGSWQTTAQLNNLKDPLLSHVARSVNALAASTIVLADLGATYNIRVLCLPAHNLGKDATIRVRGYSDAGYTAMVAGADTGTVTVWPDGFTAQDVAAYPKNWTYCFPSFKAARYWKWEPVDTTNTAGYIEAGRAWHGEATLEPVTGIQYGDSLGYESRDVVEESLGGVLWGEKRSARRVSSVSFPNITPTERNKALIMQKTLGKTGEVLFVANSLDTAQDMLLQAFPATIRQASPLTNPYYNNYEMPLELQEII